MRRAGSSSSEEEEQKIAVAREEIAVLDALSSGLSTKISELLRQRPQFEKRESGVAYAIHESRYSSLEAYRELAQHSYGRTVVGKEIDEQGRPQRSFTYRVTQANVGFVEGNCNVLARNSPMASKLVAVDPGEEVEVKVPRGIRFLAAEQARAFDGPTGLLSSSQRPSFRSMVISSGVTRKQVLVRNLRQFAEGFDDQGLSLERLEPEEKFEATTDDPTWVTNWQDIYLSDSESSSLSGQFFTRTTSKQENALNQPRGLTFVEGIAGSGKTSVALGRLKFFANFESGQHLEEYGLKNAGVKDFLPTNMVGFVLSHSLKRYLKEAASALNMSELPVWDFQEFRSDLSNRFGLAKVFRRDRAEASLVRTQLPWLLAIDATLARISAKRIREVLDSAPDVMAPVRGAVLRVLEELQDARPNEGRSRFYMHGLAASIADAAMDA
jgi:hypothetical protein